MVILEKRFTKTQVLKAAKLWDENPGLRGFRQGTRYEVIIEGKAYPPKAIISIANELATKGKEILYPDDFIGAWEGKWHQALAAADPAFKPVPKNETHSVLGKTGGLKTDKAIKTKDLEELFLEGKSKGSFKFHTQRERNPRVIENAKQIAKESGNLFCAACGFNFAKVYGERGEGYIEGHHTKPISKMKKQGEETMVKDIALVCSNCHRMLHRTWPLITVDKLKRLIKKEQKLKTL